MDQQQTYTRPDFIRPSWVIALAIFGERPIDIGFDALSLDGERPTSDYENMMRFATELEAQNYIDTHRREIARFSRDPKLIYCMDLCEPET